MWCRLSAHKKRALFVPDPVDYTPADDPPFTFEPFFKVSIRGTVLALGFSFIGAFTIWP